MIVSAGSCDGDNELPVGQTDWCLSEEPIRIATDELAVKIFTDDPRLAEFIVAHNERGAQECGWRF